MADDLGVGGCFFLGGNEEVTSGPKPPGLALALALLTKIDVRRLLDIDWQSGIWSLAIINYDWPSNSVVVELKGKADSYPPESTYAKAPIKAKFCTTAQSNHQLNITGTFSVPVQDFHLQKQAAWIP